MAWLLPEPVRVAVGELDAFVTNDRVPVAAPAACGANVTENGNRWPAARAMGKLIPPREYPDPVSSTVDIVTSLLPAIKVPFKTAVVPTPTFPKFNADGETVIGVGVPEFPFPVSETGRTGSVASLMIETLPFTAPFTFGENSMPRVMLSPGVIVMGKAGTLPRRKPCPATLIRETMMFAPSVAELLTANELDRVPPTGTVPNWTPEAAIK